MRANDTHGDRFILEINKKYVWCRRFKTNRC